jgi:hypothetical protein
VERVERRLDELNPRWILDADGMQCGVSFDCLACATPHRVRFVWDERWQRTGREFHSLSITPSIHVQLPCQFHGWITTGRVHW